MKKLVFCILSLLFVPFSLNAQQEYFQQEVNITIEVTLDDVNHTLQGNIEMEYNHPEADKAGLIFEKIRIKG